MIPGEHDDVWAIMLRPPGHSPQHCRSPIPDTMARKAAGACRRACAFRTGSTEERAIHEVAEVNVLRAMTAPRFAFAAQRVACLAILGPISIDPLD